MIVWPKTIKLADREAKRARELDDRRREAIASRDPVEYFRACQAFGIDENSAELPDLYSQGAAIVASERRDIGFSETRAQEVKALTQRRYDKLFRLVEGSGIDMRVGRDTERKRSFLLEAGYQPFKGNGGVEILIEKASSNVIGNSFRIIYRQACAHASRE